MRPYFLHLWVAQTIIARWAWLKAHPGAVKERFGEESVTDWLHVTWAFAERWVLHELTLAKLLEHLFWEIERIQLMLEESPWMVGGGEWAQALLVACGNVALYYHELRRRYGAQTARAKVRDVLEGYITWQPEPQAAEASEPAENAAPQGQPNEVAAAVPLEV